MGRPGPGRNPTCKSSPFLPVSGILCGMSGFAAQPIAIASLVLLALLLLAWLPRRAWGGPSWGLFRCLLPSWRFFDQIGVTAVLRYRQAPNGDDWGPWTDALEVPLRTAGSLLLNSAGNLHLACRSLAEHLMADLEAEREAEAEDERGREAWVSYRLVCALVEQRVRGASPPGSSLRYQFRLVEAGQGDSRPLFQSGVHGVR